MVEASPKFCDANPNPCEQIEVLLVRSAELGHLRTLKLRCNSSYGKARDGRERRGFLGIADRVRIGARQRRDK